MSYSPTKKNIPFTASSPTKKSLPFGTKIIKWEAVIYGRGFKYGAGHQYGIEKGEGYRGAYKPNLKIKPYD